MKNKIRILLAEDQAMVRGALTALLQLEDDLEVVAEVSQGDQVLLAAVKVQPDVALLDIEMPGSDGLSAAEALHKRLPSCRIVILTTFGRSGYLRRAMESGAVGFLLKDAPADQLAVAIRRVMASYAMEEHRLSERRACRTLNLNRCTFRYPARKTEDVEITQELRQLVECQPRWGCDKMTDYLRNQGHPWNHKRIRRVYRALSLHLQRKSKKTPACSDCSPASGAQPSQPDLVVGFHE